MSRFHGFVDEALQVLGRLVAFALVAAAIFFVLGVVLSPLFPGGLPSGWEGLVLHAIIGIIALLAANIAIGVGLERGTWDKTGMGRLGWRPLALAGGPLFGAIVVVVPVAVAFQQGSEAPFISSRFGDAAVLIALTALVDTLMWRGYVTGLIAARAGTLAALAVAALSAAVLATRAADPTLVTISYATAFAVFLTMLRIRTQSLMTAWLAQATAEVLVELSGDIGMGLVGTVTLVLVTFLQFRPRRRTEGSPRVSRRG